MFRFLIVYLLFVLFLYHFSLPYTCTFVGLIDAAPVPPHKNLHGHIPLKATLIVVPPHLMKQWPNEITRFTGKHFNVITIMTFTDVCTSTLILSPPLLHFSFTNLFLQLKKLTIKKLKEADIVIASSAVLRSKTYLPYLSHLSGGKDLPSSHGRIFESIYQEKLVTLRDRVAQLQVLASSLLLYFLLLIPFFLFL